MWVFGYGSLMWDGWEEPLQGKRADGAALKGYSRSFNKKSTQNWGTRAAPGPTLGLEPDAALDCIGTAFELADAHRSAIETMLRQREGESFTLTELPVSLPDGRTVLALTPVNDRAANTYIGRIALSERAAMARAAVGTSGRCADYVRNIHRKLQSLGIADNDVETFLVQMDSSS